MIFLYDLGLIVVILVLQTTLAEFVADLAGAKPDLILLLIVGFGLIRGKKAGIGYGWVLGLLQDGLSGSLLGQNVLSKGLIGYVTGALHRNLGYHTMITHLLVVPLATLFDAAIHLGAIFLLYGVSVDKTVWITLGTVVLLNTTVSPLVSWVVRTYTLRVKRSAGDGSLGRSR
jgi:rod shape-determining protein MreD